jgi:DNA-binding beta-propeller fold protein YncE
MTTVLLLHLLVATDPVTSVQFTTVAVPLPGMHGSASLDYFAAERAAGRVWIPEGTSGTVYVLDLATKKIVPVGGFGAGRPGPSAVSLGDGWAFVGNRRAAELCAVNVRLLTKSACASLAASSDGVAYVASTKEVWVTSPGDRMLTIVDVHDPAHPKQTAQVAVPGQPEGYAVDDARALFFTNLEDKNQTLAVDVRTRKVVQTWSAHCGAGGPRGLAYDGQRQFLFVACTDGARVLDARIDGNHDGPDGALLSSLTVGAGVDNIDYLDATHRLYVAAGKASRLSVAEVSNKGEIVQVALAPTAPGARVVVVAADGTAVVGDPTHGGVLVLSPVH